MIQDLKIVRDSATKGIAYIEWIEGPTKTRKAGLNKRPRPLTQKLLKTGGPRCPVMFFFLGGGGIVVKASSVTPVIKSSLFHSPLKE